MFSGNRLRQPYACIVIIKVRYGVRVRKRTEIVTEEFIKGMSAILF